MQCDDQLHVVPAAGQSANVATRHCLQELAFVDDLVIEENVTETEKRGRGRRVVLLPALSTASPQ